MNEERIREVFSNKEFLTELIAMEVPEEIQTALAEKDIDFTIDEICKMKEMVEKGIEKATVGEELTEEELAEVAGGNPLIIIPIALVVVFGGAYGVSTATRGRW